MVCQDCASAEGNQSEPILGFRLQDVLEINW